MKRFRSFTTITKSLVFSALVFAFVLVLVQFVPTSVLAFSGGGHYWGAEAGVKLFMSETWDPAEIDRDRKAPLYPQLALESLWFDPGEGCCDEEDIQTRNNWDWVRTAAQEKDDLDDWGTGYGTKHHFWYADDGLHENPDGTVGWDNAWEWLIPTWTYAIEAWRIGSIGAAYTHLGYSIHLIQDMAQPAHANDDMHPGDGFPTFNDDSLEDWLNEAYCRANFEWDTSNPSSPTCSGCGGGTDFLTPPTENVFLLLQMLSADDNWVAIDDDEILDDPYLMYYVNQTGNYFASDGEWGNSWDPIGWLNGYVGWPTAFHEECINDVQHEISIHDPDGLDDNDEDDTDCDGDLSLIMEWSYGTSFRSVPAMINLFRRTVDNVPPDTTVVMSRDDGQPVVEWNNSPVTLQLTGSVDGANDGFPPSGVWKVWGLHIMPEEINGIPPADENAPSWVLSEDGTHTIECLSTDWIGNVDTKDVTVKFDGTPPEITFPSDYKSMYLTSEDFVVGWAAVDETSGVDPDSEIAYLNGQEVNKGDIIDLALMAGMNQLEVEATDFAGNTGYAVYEFEVVIDADGWCLPKDINNKSKAKSMYCAVEFPAPYDVGLIDYTKSTLIVNGVELPATEITGVGDTDGDHNPDRRLRFSREQFITAIAGQVGDIQAEIWGELFPDGLPRFVADVTVSVFSPPEKN